VVLDTIASPKCSKVATAGKRRVGPVPRGVERNRWERSVKVATAEQASRRPSSETGTRRGVKQNTEAENGSSMVAESNHLLSWMREVAMGLPSFTKPIVYIQLRRSF